jgi:monoterpene epsilon-lactone hydrolase
MKPYSAEQKIRASFPFIRFMQAYLPLPVSGWLLKQSMARVRLDAAVTREVISAGGVLCESIVPHDNLPGRVLLYLHGGGFVFGLTPFHLKMGAYLAQKMAMRILMVDYRLAPDHPFPASLEDCVTSYLWLLEQGISAQNILMAGDSAGGNLTITSLMKLRDCGFPLPAAAACLSPVTDLTVKDILDKGFKDPLLPPKAVRFYTNSYVGDNDARDPLISPVFGNLHNLSPLLIHAGEDEILREDAVHFASLAKAAGVDVQLEIYPHMWHVWQLYLTLPQAVQSLENIAKYLGSHLGSVTV